MSVHFAPKEDPHRKNVTVKHTKPYCTCPDGKDCKTGQGEPGGRVKKGQAKLEGRQRVYDGMRDDQRRSLHHTKRPGSLTK